ncbi:MAG: hypothetical protein AMJ56_17190 [Anaerolineae bacterium SG8_19]|nr:MAG: hypothetical protein AMJ56_17190 [Anaerolineae bacterium SG8_19]
MQLFANGLDICANRLLRPVAKMMNRPGNLSAWLAGETLPDHNSIGNRKDGLQLLLDHQELTE